MKKMFKVAGILLGLSVVPSATLVAGYDSMGCYDLWYARNAIFADAGQCFSKSRTIQVFGKRCYAPYGRLNDYDDRRVNEIKYWENRKGCRNGYGGYTRPSTPSYSTGGRVARVSGIRWNDTLAVRTGPSTRYHRIGDLPPDARGVEILNCVRKWCRIRYGNLVGWSYAKYLRSE